MVGFTSHEKIERQWELSPPPSAVSNFRSGGKVHGRTRLHWAGSYRCLSLFFCELKIRPGSTCAMPPTKLFSSSLRWDAKWTTTMHIYTDELFFLLAPLSLFAWCTLDLDRCHNFDSKQKATIASCWPKRERQEPDLDATTTMIERTQWILFDVNDSLSSSVSHDLL